MRSGFLKIKVGGKNWSGVDLTDQTGSVAPEMCYLYSTLLIFQSSATMFFNFHVVLYCLTLVSPRLCVVRLKD